VNTRKAEAALAYQLQSSKLQQEIKKETVEIEVGG